MASFVVLCTGMNTMPHMPNYPVRGDPAGLVIRMLLESWGGCCGI